MSVSFLAAQLRRVRVALAIPLVAAVVTALVGRLAAAAWSSMQGMALAFGLRQIFVICSGVAVAIVLTGDPLVELHEATPASFRRVQVVRAVAVTASAVIGAVVMFAPLHVAGVWMQDKGWITVVIPIGSAVTIAAAAFGAAAYTGSASSTTIVVTATWLFLAALWDPYVEPLLLRRGIPVLIATILAVRAWRRLGDAERNISQAVAAA